MMSAGFDLFARSAWNKLDQKPYATKSVSHQIKMNTGKQPKRFIFNFLDSESLHISYIIGFVVVFFNSEVATSLVSQWP